MLTFGAPDAGALHMDLFSLCWSKHVGLPVAYAACWRLALMVKLKAGGPTGGYVIYSANTRFIALIVSHRRKYGDIVCYDDRRFK